MSRVYASILLGWHFLLHYLKKLTFQYDPGGLKQFRENFDDEGLGSLSEEDRRALHQWQRCIGCGLCEAACPELSVIPENRHAGPRYLAMAAMRDLSEPDLAIPTADIVSSGDCERAEAVCPVDIPLEDIADFLRRQNEQSSRRHDDTTVETSP
jgi:succinate dehydrogenase/fumarate reductase-like Fe-S protein